MQRYRQFRRRKAVALGAAGLLIFACNKSPTGVEQAAEVSAKVAQVAAAVTGQNAPMADQAQQGHFVGFDTHTYPGDEKMRAWKNAPNAPYHWVGYYLPAAPCHKGTSWRGKRQTLVDMGWGIAVVYVGQQTWNRTPRPRTAAQVAAGKRGGQTCSADYLNASTGTEEAIDAIQKTEAETFPRGTVIFLDIERMEQMPTVMRDYYRAWVATVLKDGRYRPGVYVHSHNAKAVYDDVKALFVAAGSKEEPRFWIASARDFDTSKKPTEVGHEFAGMWQGVIDVVRKVANVALPIDINVSNWPSPSDVLTE
ncbi:MAG TPA: glycoside hydrolase domain-containing protein [Gemmatimonadaceae bacterium]|nr:glycoside hydrolase domain-containing protein [Gemmatimonadaceae bacterium]